MPRPWVLSGLVLGALRQEAEALGLQLRDATFAGCRAVVPPAEWSPHPAGKWAQGFASWAQLWWEQESRRGHPIVGSTAPPINEKPSAASGAPPTDCAPSGSRCCSAAAGGRPFLTPAPSSRSAAARAAPRCRWPRPARRRRCRGRVAAAAGRWPRRRSPPGPRRGVGDQTYCGSEPRVSERRSPSAFGKAGPLTRRRSPGRRR
jgi:hypothetical protein